MKTLLTDDQVKHVASLSQLVLTPREVESLRDQLSATLDYVAVLNELSTGQTAPLSQVTGLDNVSRPDEVSPSLPAEKILAASRGIHGQFFKVKYLLEKKK